MKKCNFPPKRKPVLVSVTDIGHGRGGPLVACHQTDGLWLLKKSSAVEYSVVDKFLLLRTAQSGNIWFNKLEIKREKRKEIRKSSPLGLNIGQKYLNVATTPHHGPLHLPHMKFNPFGLLTEHLLCQVGLTQFPATCCGPAVTLRLPPSHPSGGDDGLLLRATLGAPGWGYHSAVGPCRTWSHPSLLLTGLGATCVCSVLYERHSELMTDPRYVPCDWCTGSQDILPLLM